MIKRVVQPVQFFLMCWLLWLIVVMGLLLFFPKGVLELEWNKYHTSFLDSFFLIVTDLGNGIAFLIVVLILLFFDRVFFYIALTTSIICLIVTFLMKQFFFVRAKRPLSYFDDSANIHLPEGAERLFYNSFPSGHTLAAFAMFLLVTYFLKNKMLQLLFFMMAALIGFSRVYLMAHFIEDVWFGSFLGVLISFSVIFLFQNYFSFSNSSPLIRIYGKRK